MAKMDKGGFWRRHAKPPLSNLAILRFLNQEQEVFMSMCVGIDQDYTIDIGIDYYIHKLIITWIINLL